MPAAQIPAGKNQWLFLPWPSGPDNSIVTQKAWLNLITGGVGAHAVGHVWFIGQDNSGGTPTPTYLHEEDFTLAKDVFKGWECPANTASITVFISETTNPVGWALELLAK